MSNSNVALYSTTHSTAGNIKPVRPIEAFERVKAQIEALDADDVVHVNLDVSSSVTTVLGAMPEIMSFRTQVEASLPTIHIAVFDSLLDYTRALWYTHTLYESS